MRIEVIAARRHIADRRAHGATFVELDQRRARGAAVVATIRVVIGDAGIAAHQRQVPEIVAVRIALGEELELVIESERHAVTGQPVVEIGQFHADGAGHYLRTPVRDLVVGKGRLQQHLVVRALERGVVGYVVGVAVVLRAVPEHLHQRKADVTIEIILIGQVQRKRIRRQAGLQLTLEVHTATQQRGVVHADHAEHAAGDVLGQGHHRATGDTALGITVVENLDVVEQRQAVAVLEFRMRAKALGVAQRARQEHEVQQALLRAVRDHREVREVRQHRQHIGDVAGGETEQVHRAEQEVVIDAELRNIVVSDGLETIQQAVAVDAGPCRVVRGRLRRNLAHETRGHARHAVRQAVTVELAQRVGRVLRIIGAVEQAVGRQRAAVADAQHVDAAAGDICLRELRAQLFQRERGIVQRRRVGGHHEGRHGDGALDALGDVAARIRDHAVNGEARRGTQIGDVALGIFQLAQLCESGIAHVAQTADVVFGAGDGEVPGQVQTAVALHTDARAVEHREHLLGQRHAAIVDWRQAGCHTVTAGGERSLRPERAAGLGRQVLEHHHVTPAFGEVGRRADQDRGAGLRRRVRVVHAVAGQQEAGIDVQLGPDRVQLAGHRVEHQYRGCRVQ